MTAKERPLTPYLSAEARYANDPGYHAMVDAITCVIAHLEMTPAEVREAAVFACIRFEMLNICHYRFEMDRGLLDARAKREMHEKAVECEARASSLAKWLKGER